MRPLSPRINHDPYIYSDPDLVQHALNAAIAEQTRWVAPSIIVGAVRLADRSYRLASPNVVIQAKRLDNTLGAQLEPVNDWTDQMDIPSLLSIYEEAKLTMRRNVAVQHLRPYVAEHLFYEDYNDCWRRIPFTMLQYRSRRGVRIASATHDFFERHVQGYQEPVDERHEGGMLAARIVRKMI